MSVEYEQVLERVCRQLEKIAGPEVELNADTDLIDGLDLDSFKVLDLLLEVEDEFDISIPVNVLAEVHTLGELSRKIQELT